MVLVIGKEFKTFLQKNLIFFIWFINNVYSKFKKKLIILVEKSSKVNHSPQTS